MLPRVCRLCLLVAQALDRIELRGSCRWHSAENHSYHRGNYNCDNPRQSVDWNAVLREEAYGVRDGVADHNSGESPDKRDENSLGEKLKADFPVGGADGLTDADFADARSHSRQHDV